MVGFVRAVLAALTRMVDVILLCLFYKNINSMDNFHQLTCPHCSGTIIVLHHELNCRIFRHGAFVSNGEPIPPHSSRAECDRLVADNLIVGCGKPFRVVLQDGVETAIECDYI